MTWWERYEQLYTGQLPVVEAVFDANPILRATVASMQLEDKYVRRLASDPSPAVRAVIASRPDLSDRLVDDLSWDVCEQVRARIATRPDLSDTIRQRLLDDTSPLVLEALGYEQAAHIIRSLPAPLTDDRKKTRLW